MRVRKCGRQSPRAGKLTSDGRSFGSIDLSKSQVRSSTSIEARIRRSGDGRGEAISGQARQSLAERIDLVPSRWLTAVSVSPRANLTLFRRAHRPRRSDRSHDGVGFEKHTQSLECTRRILQIRTSLRLRTSNSSPRRRLQCRAQRASHLRAEASLPVHRDLPHTRRANAVSFVGRRGTRQSTRADWSLPRSRPPSSPMGIGRTLSISSGARRWDDICRR